MAIYVSWGNAEKTYLLYKFYGKWTWQELFEAELYVHEMMDNITHRVYSLVDITESNTVPNNVLSSARTMDKQHDNRRGLMVVVGGSHLLSVLVDTLRRMGNRMAENVCFTQTVEEGIDLLNRQSM